MFENLPGEGPRWVFLIDPVWKPAPDEDDQVEAPPVEAVVGGWLTAEDGSTGRFLPNPEYAPSSPHSPTDPVDAALRMTVSEEITADRLLEIVREWEFAVALDADDEPITAPAPDDVMSLLVTTAPAHRSRVEAAAGWREVDAVGLAALLTERQVDVLINPGAQTSTRLLHSAVCRAVAADEEQPGGGASSSTDPPPLV